MSKEILFATSNSYKKERFQAYFQSLGLSIISFTDLEQKIEVVEDGETPEENALIKALTGFKATGIPTLGVDYWLRIKGFPENQQPGPFVRRIFIGPNYVRVEASDRQMLDYYTKQIAKLGGQTTGIWTSAIALVTGPGLTFSKTFSRETIFTSQISPTITEGEPLNSIQIHSEKGKFLSELTPNEWIELQREREENYIGFMRDHLSELK